MKFRSKFVLIAALVVAGACSGNKAPAMPGTPTQKLTALKAAEAMQTSLVQAVQGEAKICNEAQAAANPMAPITECAGPLATAARLTTANHQQFSGGMLKAFEFHRAAIVRLDAWKPGEAMPAELTTFESQIRLLLSASQGLTGADAQALTNILQRIMQSIADVRATIAQLRSDARPLNLGAAVPVL